MESYIEEFQDEREKKSDLIVVVDGPSAAGKGTLAEHIAGELGIEHFSASDVFYQIAEERGLEDSELAEEAGKDVDLAVDRKTLERGLSQSCVIDGRIAAWVLGDYADLTIHLTADLEERARRLAEREGKELEKARGIVEKRDREDSRRYQEYYGVDTSEIDIYDVVVDNTEISIQEQNEQIDGILRHRFPEKTEN